MAGAQIPNGDMTADQLIALFANEDRHPNALGYEMKRCKMAVIIRLAYGELPPTRWPAFPMNLALWPTTKWSAAMQP